MEEMYRINGSLAGKVKLLQLTHIRKSVCKVDGQWRAENERKAANVSSYRAHSDMPKKRQNHSPAVQIQVS